MLLSIFIWYLLLWLSYSLLPATKDDERWILANKRILGLCCLIIALYKGSSFFVSGGSIYELIAIANRRLGPAMWPYFLIVTVSHLLPLTYLFPRGRRSRQLEWLVPSWLLIWMAASLWIYGAPRGTMVVPGWHSFILPFPDWFLDWTVLPIGGMMILLEIVVVRFQGEAQQHHFQDKK